MSASNAPQPSNRVENAHSDSIWSVAWSGSERLLSGSLDGSIRLWNSRSLDKALFATSKERVGVNSIATSDDGRYCVACYQDATIRIFNITESGLEERQEALTNHLLEAWTLSLSPDNETFVTGTQTGVLHLSTVSNGQRLLTLNVPSSQHVHSTSFNNDGSEVACGTSGGKLCGFDPVSQKVTYDIQSHSLPIRSLSFQQSHQCIIYTASEDKTVTINDIRTNKAVQSFSHNGMCLSVDASPNGRQFVCGSSDNTVTLWDLGMRSRVTTYSTHTDQIWSVRYDRTDKTGRRFVSGGDDSLLQLYE